MILGEGLVRVYHKRLQKKMKKVKRTNLKLIEEGEMNGLRNRV